MGIAPTRRAQVMGYIRAGSPPAKAGVSSAAELPSTS